MVELVDVLIERNLVKIAWHSHNFPGELANFLETLDMIIEKWEELKESDTT